MKKEYRREMETLGPRPEELERLYQMIEGGTEMKRQKRLGRRAVAAIVVCAVLTVTAAAAAIPTVWETLASHLGVFAPYAKTIEGAVCADQGIEIQVLSALSDDLETRVYLSVQDVEGDRLNQFLKLTGELTTGEAKKPDGDGPGDSLNGWGFPFVNYFKLVSYDSETKTALFSGSILYSGTIQPTHETQLQLSITGMSTREAELYASVFCAEVTGKVLDSLPGETDQLISQSGSMMGGGYEPTQRVVLAPGQTPMDIEGTEDMRVSSMGFASDGHFHIRLEFADGVEPVITDTQSGQPDSRLFCDLFDETGFDSRMYTIWKTPVEGGVDILFPLITAEDLDEIRNLRARIYGTYTRPGTDVEGDWSTQFELDYYPSTALDWTGDVAGCQVKLVTVSPLSVSICSDSMDGFPATLYALKKDGSTVAAELNASSLVNLDDYAEMASLDDEAEYAVFNAWKFEEPVDVEDIVSLTLGDTTIPMK